MVKLLEKRIARGILYKGEMVRKILLDEKTQTRRAINGQESDWASVHPDGSGRGWIAWAPKAVSAGFTKTAYPGEEGFRCPYGVPGDLLWVRENFYVQPELWAENHGPQPVHYACDTKREEVEDYVQKPSIHMPRWASRITLEITDVRVERLQEITHEDAVSEGIPNLPGAQAEYRILWDSINGKRKGLAWKDDPWVWVITFRRLK